mgnify:CR=1 FL=1
MLEGVHQPTKRVIQTGSQRVFSSGQEVYRPFPSVFFSPSLFVFVSVICLTNIFVKFLEQGRVFFDMFGDEIFMERWVSCFS